ncbi:ATP-binding protein [Alicyclobacillus sp. ALC3]|uniref:ATP-binding protein n=1 Tax=Alicyclobacillus sp. ALC3 TaxID=2796143 RepID=UPI0023783628|nr:ATP-binding protein [Alicyclobacillus sp. ALC3]WDL95106.1 hypothetical protein JC200_11760 [Alicyclobacillus sp. ALC3]
MGVRTLYPLSRMSGARHNLGTVILAQIAAVLILVTSHVVLLVRAHTLQSEVVKLSYINSSIDRVQNDLYAAFRAEKQYVLTKNRRYLINFLQAIATYESLSSNLQSNVNGFVHLAPTALAPISLGQKWLSVYGKPQVALIRHGSHLSTPVSLSELPVLSLFDEKTAAANAACETRIISIIRKLTLVDRLSGLMNAIVLSLTTVMVIMLIRRHIRDREKLVEYEKAQLVEHLAASMAHEIRNPLQVTRGFMQLIRERVIDADITQYLTYAINELDAAHHILSEYLGLSKPQSAELQLEPLHTIVADVSELLTAYGNEYGCQINCMKSDIPNAQFDSRKLKQVLLNIGKNAIEAMGQGGKLSLRIEPSQSRITIQIEDNGPGMSKEQMSRLGQPFYSTKTDGTGIGLMIAYRLVEDLHGRITVTSTPGNGTCFQVHLPIETHLTGANTADTVSSQPQKKIGTTS